MIDEQVQPAGQVWRDRAACRGTDPEVFFPVAESGPAREAQVAAAKAVCAGCPVRAECLTEALARIPYGIAGGLTENERRRLRTGQRTRGRGGLSAAAREVLSDGPRPGMTDRERAGVGRELLANGRRPRQVAAACRVSERTAERWATTNTTTTTSPASTASTATGGRVVDGAGEGSAAATGLPSGSPQHTTTPARDTGTGRTRA